jgi:hypothetical protein
MTTRHVRKGAKCQCTSGCTEKALPGGAMCLKHQHNGCSRVSPVTGSEPPYIPGVYNDSKITKDNHNCFAYAFNIREDLSGHCADKDNCTLSFHQPGRGTGFRRFRDVKKIQCPDLLARLYADVPDLTEATFEQKCPVGTSKIALVIDPKNDYHFYRQDRGGLWSHKPGGGSVTNRDAAGNLIYDPAIADRNYKSNKKGSLDYSVFCSYMCAPRSPLATRRVKRGGKRSEHKRSEHKRRKTRRKEK